MSGVSGGLTGLVLAAGGGSRLGGGKLLLPWRGAPLINHVLDALIGVDGVDSVAVVVGDRAQAMRRAVESRFPHPAASPRVVENPDWREGQGASIRVGVEAILSAPETRGTHGILVMLGDQPLIGRATIAALAAAHRRACERDPGHFATAPVFAGRRGHPVIFAVAAFSGLLALRGDTGGRHLLATAGDRLLLVPVDDPGIHRDVDTPDDYRALLSDP